MNLRKFLPLFLILFCPNLYAYTTVSGSIAGNTSWASGTYYLSSSVTFDSGADLTISAGVVVKGASGAYLTLNSEASNITVNGTSGSPVYFTSKNDNSVGESIDGSTGSPAAGDWGGVDSSVHNHASTIDYGIISYGTIGFMTQGNYTSYTIRDSISHHNSSHGFSFHRAQTGDNPVSRCIAYSNGGSGFTTVTAANAPSTTFQDCISYSNTGAGFNLIQPVSKIYNCLSYSNGTYGAQGLNLDVKNSTMVSNTSHGVYVGGNYCTLNVINTILKDNGGWGVYFSGNYGTPGTITYTDTHNNTSGAYSLNGSSAPTASNNITTDPTFQSGTLVGGLFGSFSASYFLDQSTSPCKDTGSDTAANLGYNTYTTSIDKTTDSGTIDIGYHYTPAIVSAAAPAVAGQVIMVNVP